MMHGWDRVTLVIRSGPRPKLESVAKTLAITKVSGDGSTTSYDFC
jgi:hypothetical protein